MRTYHEITLADHSVDTRTLSGDAIAAPGAT